MGKLPASQASAEVLSAFRAEERQNMKKLLDNYLRICVEAKVILSFSFSISISCFDKYWLFHHVDSLFFS